ncbi:MAG: DegV family protein [Acidimicrobiales bacterium]
MRIVVDGAVDLPTAEVRISSVPAKIFKDHAEWSGPTEQFWRLLREDPIGWTSAPPSIEDLSAAYAGAEPVLAVHVSAELSATVEHAHAAAERAPGRVEVCDSRSLSVGAGLVATKVTTEAISPQEALAEARALAGHIHTYALVDQVDYLLRSGRVGLLAGSHLKSKRHYLLALRGHAIPLGDSRSRQTAFASLLDHVHTTAHHGVAAWALAHGAAADGEALAEQAGRTLGLAADFVVILDPTVGIHLGPDAVVLAALDGVDSARAAA